MCISPWRALLQLYAPCIHPNQAFCRKLAGIIIFLLSIFYSNSSFGQSPSIEWQKSLGGSEIENAYSIQQTTDGGYIVAGYSYSNDDQVSGNHGMRDIWLIKLDEVGNLEWQRSLGGIGDDEARSVQQTADGGYIVAGYTSANGGDVNGYIGLNDYWIVKLDAVGNIQWQKPLGGSWKEEAYSIQQTTDGGYIVCGRSESNNFDVSSTHGFYDCWVVKLDASGNIQWERSLGGSGYEEAHFIRQTSDGGYIIAGSSNSTDGDLTSSHGEYDAWIVKLDPTGNIEWQKSLGGTATDAATAIQQSTDGGYIVVGSSSSSDGDATVNHGSSDYWIVKLDETGNIQWQKSLGGSSDEGPSAVQQTIDGGYIVGGYTKSTDGDVNGNHGYGDCWLIKLDVTGNVEWQKTMGGTNGEGIASLQQTADGGYIIAGGSDSNDGDISGNHGTSDILVIKLCNLLPTPGSIVGSITPCIGTTISYSISTVSGAATYTWTIPDDWVILSGQGTNSISVTPGTNSGSITVTANNICGNSPSQILAVALMSAVTPTISISSPTTNICSGSSITFTATATQGGASPVYQWKKNGINVGINSFQYTDASLNDNDIISCELTSSETCAITPIAISNAITLAQAASESVSITSSATMICKNDKVIFYATAINAGASPIYYWQLNGVNVGDNSSTYSTSDLDDQDEIMCRVLVQGNSCSPGGVPSNVITITVHPLPVISITPLDTLVLNGSQVQLHALISGNIMSYEWLPSAGLVDAFLLNPVTVPISATTQYSLMVKSEDGCHNDKKITISVYNNLYVPSAFTPNGDGLNDIFRIPPNVSLQLKDLSVYNRWGQKVFSTTDISKGWDGVNYPSGLYIYVIYGTNNKGPVYMKGSVTLIR